MQERISGSKDEWFVGPLAVIARAVGQWIKRLDHWLTPVSDWQWVGKGDILYRRVVERRGFQFIGELCVDRQTVAAYLGSFGDAPQPGAYEVGVGRYFMPATRMEQRVCELIRSGVQPAQASKFARAALLDDMQRADECGKTWFNYVLTVSAKRGNRVLSEVTLWGVDAQPSVDCMDARVQQLFESLIDEAEQDALQELKHLGSVAMRAS